MIHQEIVDALERFAPLSLQMEFDNSGWQVGNPLDETTGALVALELTEQVLEQAIELDYNLVIVHHPLIFRPLRNMAGGDWVQRLVRMAIRSDIAVYAIHTNIDSVINGVSGTIAARLSLENIEPLVANAVGSIDGLGVIGRLPVQMDEMELLAFLRHSFGADGIRYSAPLSRPVSRVAICGGSGGEFLPQAIAAEADVYITADLKYHTFFEADGELLLVDLGHYESEQYIKEVICSVIRNNFPNFATQTSSINTNPINYL